LPIVASRGNEIRRWIKDLAEPAKRGAAKRQLKALGARVVPHADEELTRLDSDARRALAEALKDVDTTDARALKKRLNRADTRPAAPPKPQAEESGETQALAILRKLPPPRPTERAAISRDRSEAHLSLARGGSRLARKDLLISLATLGAERSRLYCEAAGLIGDKEFITPLARLAASQSEALTALSMIAAREGITPRSKSFRDLDEGIRAVVARALVRGGRPQPLPSCRPNIA
jgi:hypothetical protein